VTYSTMKFITMSKPKPVCEDATKRRTAKVALG